MAKTSRREPSPFEIRELTAADLGNGFLETIGSLSDVEGLTRARARKILSATKRAPPNHVFVASTAGGKVVGATTLLVEQKFIHGGGLVGHIEDVAVMKGYQGVGVGSSLVTAAVATARGLGCYKCILDCKEELVGFYGKLGFRVHDVGMRIDLKRAPTSKRAPRASSRNSGTGT